MIAALTLAPGANKKHTYLLSHRSRSQCKFKTCQGPRPIDIERKNRLLKVCYVPATCATFLAFFSFFLAVAINSTNEAYKAGGTCH